MTPSMRAKQPSERDSLGLGAYHSAALHVAPGCASQVTHASRQAAKELTLPRYLMYQLSSCGDQMWPPKLWLGWTTTEGRRPKTRVVGLVVARCIAVGRSGLSLRVSVLALPSPPLNHTGGST